MIADRRAPLTRDRVALGALDYIDRYGLAGMSMRKLGSHLGVEAMSLYNHVKSKEDLFQAVADVIYAEVLLDSEPDVASHWQDEAARVAFAYRDAAMRHPNAFPLVADQPTTGENGVRFLERCYRVFADAGLDVKEAAMAFNVAGSWVIGAIRQELGLMAALRAGGGFRSDQVPPELSGVIDFKEACLASTPDERFAYGLAVVIAGLEATIAGTTAGRSAGASFSPNRS